MWMGVCIDPANILSFMSPPVSLPLRAVDYPTPFIALSPITSLARADSISSINFLSNSDDSSRKLIDSLIIWLLVLIRSPRTSRSLIDGINGFKLLYTFSIYYYCAFTVILKSINSGRTSNVSLKVIPTAASRISLHILLPSLSYKLD